MDSKLIQLSHGVGRNFDYVRTVQVTPQKDRQALLHEFVDQLQHPNHHAIVGKPTDKVIAPYVIGSGCSVPHG